MSNAFRRILIFGGAFLFALGALTQPDCADGMTYKTSLNTINKLGLDLQKAVKAEYRDKIHVKPVSIESDVMPFVKLEEYPDEPKPLPMVFISVGFIDLVSMVAHAKAIDMVEKGYFEKYVLSLAQETGEKELRPLPNDSNKAYWTDKMIDEQYGNFNSIVGVMLGIKLAHHYLGHYHKYADQLRVPDGKNQPPIANFLTPKEWEEALRYGALNAMHAGCMIEGVLPFFECFEQMPQRPAWTAYFVPNFARYEDIKKTLEKLQKDFFLGKGY